MQVKLIEIAAREPKGRMGLAKPYLRGRNVNGQPLMHGLARSADREYLLVAGQEIPEDLLPEVYAQYPGTERIVAEEMLKELNRKPSPVVATVVTVEIVAKGEPPLVPPKRVGGRSDTAAGRNRREGRGG